MGKTRTPLCGFRRRNKQKESFENNNMENTNQENDDELNVGNENLNYENYNNNYGENNNENNENNNNYENFENNNDQHMDVDSGENLLNLENENFDYNGNGNETVNNEDSETLNNLLGKMENEEVDLENIKNLSLTMDNNTELTNLQSFVSNKLTELLKKTSLGEKCVNSLAPLCTGHEHGPLDKLLSLGNGCLHENHNTLNNNEFQVPEKEEYRDPPTLPSGIKFVDDFNKLLDSWADQPSQGNNNYTANLFKLFNLSALLKHLGDPRYVEILNKLGVNNLLNYPDTNKKWDQILLNCENTNEKMEYAKHPLPDLPNPKAVSNCNTKLVDLPELDNNNVDEHAFKLYWAYTNTWLNKMFGPSLRNSHKFVQPTKNWYMNMERASQLFFLRLSKTLCST
ncbi:hypothetical protein TpMuguga_02g00840 [Theileria parva strain Muguga]|uniref:Uncharacterized protein n=1 Tax=Theileria parva TaxID=5875 RepID=Q4N3Z8_THEPA|nr:uncharacterized protein TpMuguga_02g00840 [Theileria parva strain Muguga]EAN33125.1 hypothetical protein TpMuguga_02g00840 [Theileria parva strain Muguga]|eukprot:XP_765408.1 hypothetical protein [Theileria parva strain Muguga]